VAATDRRKMNISAVGKEEKINEIMTGNRKTV
jgi:hypothetical protein